MICRTGRTWEQAPNSSQDMREGWGYVIDLVGPTLERSAQSLIIDAKKRKLSDNVLEENPMLKICSSAHIESISKGTICFPALSWSFKV